MLGAGGLLRVATKGYRVVGGREPIGDADG